MLCPIREETHKTSASGLVARRSSRPEHATNDEQNAADNGRANIDDVSSPKLVGSS